MTDGFEGEGPIDWASRLGFDRPDFDLRLASYLELSRPMPPGIVRRIDAPDMNDPKVQAEVDEAKRNLLKLLAVGGLAAAVGGGAVGAALQYIQPPMQGLASYPRVQLLFADGTPITTSNIDSQIDPTTITVFSFDYPLSGEVNMLLNLDPTFGVPPNGVGPKKNIVAYSAICQHLGCIPPFLSYYPASEAKQCGFNNGAPFIHCICHGSTYDPYTGDSATGGGASVLTGPTVLPLPQCLLDTDANGNIFVTSVIGPPVKGHFTTLLGGTPGPVPAKINPIQVQPIPNGQRCP